MELINSDGETVEKWTSDGTNHVVTNLPSGSYTLKEAAAPDGYVIATDISFTIDEYGNVTVDGVEANAFTEDGTPLVVMVDEAVKIPEKTPQTPNTLWTPSSPPTGDMGRSSIAIIMLIVGLSGMIFVSIKRRKRENKFAEIERKYAELCPDFIERNKEND